ncbi:MULTISPECIES: porin [unclassified Shewanella]|uniref:porin n=1 Tax=unclassified Shewanella TaxID=196818 RepID=UPI001BC30BDE|nr:MULTISPECIES: porin [unclassified Shewanella]GIU06819.1 porin [Shewanella sp. MBTL60-112-B1]GIU26316.1 porin [Shewanella sp. MBTL60-112-B2]
MKKALAILPFTALAIAPTCSAVDVFKDDKNVFQIGGYVDARVIDTQGVTEVVNGSSRINFAFTRDMSNDWTTYAKLEWGVNPFGNSTIAYSSESNFETKSGDFLNNRLGYVGLSHDAYGSITIGKQWGAWYDVVYNTNYGFVWDGNASGTYTYNKSDGAINGVGRGDKVIQYRNRFGDFSMAIQMQLKNSVSEVEDDGSNSPNRLVMTEYDNTYGIGLTYEATKMLTLTAGGNIGEPEGTTASGTVISETDYIYGVGASWGNWDSFGLYLAANVNANEYHDTDNIGRFLQEAVGLESIASYLFDNNVKILASYNILKAGDKYEAAHPGDVFKRQFAFAGVHYIWDNSVIFYLEGRVDFSDFSSSTPGLEARQALTEDDGVAVGVRYTL